MRKIVFCMMAAALFVLAGCSKNTPKGVVKTYYSALQEKNYEKSAQCFMSSDELSEDPSVQVQSFAQKTKESMEKREGLKSYEIVRDSVCSDSLAFVLVKCVFGNGEELQSDIEVVKQEGEWKINPMSK